MAKIAWITFIARIHQIFSGMTLFELFGKMRHSDIDRFCRTRFWTVHAELLGHLMTANSCFCIVNCG